MEGIKRGLALVAAGLCVLLFFEWHTDEPLVVLPVLLVLSFAAGWIVPRSFVPFGLTFGWAIPAAHALSNATGMMVPRYQKEPPTTGDWIAMSMLVLPAIGAAFAGARLSRSRRR
jgi:hypothetical protein